MALPLLAVLLFVYGAGYGLVFTKVTYLTVAGIPGDRASSASGVLLAARQTSAAIGAAALVAILQATASFTAVNAAALALIALALVASCFLHEPPAAAAVVSHP
jgi:DHA2 family methylenomycin A resistance protein-like MFS transporter